MRLAMHVLRPYHDQHHLEVGSGLQGMRLVGLEEIVSYAQFFTPGLDMSGYALHGLDGVLLHV